MSGNPFRASLVQKQHPTAAPPTSFVTVDSGTGAKARDERESDAGIHSHRQDVLLFKGSRIIVT